MGNPVKIGIRRIIGRNPSVLGTAVNLGELRCRHLLRMNSNSLPGLCFPPRLIRSLYFFRTPFIKSRTQTSYFQTHIVMAGVLNRNVPHTEGKRCYESTCPPLKSFGPRQSSVIPSFLQGRSLLALLMHFMLISPAVLKR